MKFTPRTKLILKHMLDEEGTMSIQTLADRLGISKRTVQRELEYLNSDLKSYQIKLMSKTGVGIWLEGSDTDRQRLREELLQGDEYDVSNREERRKRLVLEILKDKGLKKLFYYSSKFKVSEATISADLESVKEWLKNYEICVVRKPGSGVNIEGSEENFRRAIRAFIRENIDTKMLRDSYEKEEMQEPYDKLRKSSIGQILNEDILKRVVGCIMGMEDPRVKNLTESSYMGLVIHITIAINRILKKEMIETSAPWAEEMEKNEDYFLAERIAHLLEEEFQIEIPSLEIAYICLHIKGAKHEKISWNNDKTVEVENRRLRQLLNEMINVFGEEDAFWLRQDEEFIQGLLAHLQPTFIRLLHGMTITNPILDEIKRDYPEIYEKCEEVAEILKEYIGKDVPESEIGFLTVHFGAALVRIEDRKGFIRQVNLGVVCSSGIGISRMMSSKLERKFKSRIKITAYGKKDITPYVAGKTDFFVSSIAMDGGDTPVVYVNPLLSDEDMKQVEDFVRKYERTPAKKEKETEFSMQLEKINVVAAQINSVIKYMELFRVDENLSFQELLADIGEKLSPYSDRGEMIQEDIRKREAISSQVFAELGFALFHTRTKGVVRPAFAVYVTEDLQEFKDPYFKEIEAVFVMLAPDDENIRINSDILGYISTILVEDDDFLDIVLKGDKEKIRTAISIHLKKYFNKCLSEIGE